ncbi:hypothetical protein [Paractinoplanes globisporus]|uniref:Uncharacterized protein n=1 Tax=Paractinoplanes globisporus TaxID=113565 RepID=A0ABW6W9Z7_9ACTN|nr:hypothetical protein [Actinoplanes globisporus]
MHKLRRGSLGVLAISFFVISAAAPLTAMAGGAPVAMLPRQRLGHPGRLRRGQRAAAGLLRRRTLVAPLVGGIATTALAVYAASQFGLLISRPGSALSWLLPALIVVAAVAGLASAFVLKAKNPRAYEVMGRHRGDA